MAVLPGVCGRSAAGAGVPAVRGRSPRECEADEADVRGVPGRSGGVPAVRGGLVPRVYAGAVTVSELRAEGVFAVRPLAYEYTDPDGDQLSVGLNYSFGEPMVTVHAYEGVRMGLAEAKRLADAILGLITKAERDR